MLMALAAITYGMPKPPVAVAPAVEVSRVKLGKLAAPWRRRGETQC